MSTRFTESSGRKGLTTAYIALDQGRQRQYIDVRIHYFGRKLVIGGCFDVDFANELAGPIVSAMRDARFLREVTTDTALGG
jgi:hypothetical protein